MKKKWKIFWVVIAITGAIGIVLSGVGIVLGATLEELNMYTGDRDFEVSEYTNVTSLDCDFSIGEVEIVLYDEPVVRIESEKGMKIKDFTEESEGELTIESSKWVKRYNDDWEVTIYIPRDIIFENVDISLGAGIMDIEEISAKELSIDVGVGEASVTEGTVKELDITCGVGSLSYMASGKETDYNYLLGCGVGEIYIGGARYSGLGRNKNIYNGTDKDMNISCGVGEVEVEFQQ